MKIFFVSVLVLTALTLSAKEPEIGDLLPKEARESIDHGKYMSILADSSQMYPAFILGEGPNAFVLGINLQGRISYIAPDKNEAFKTTEGIHTGSSLASVLIHSKSPPIERPGWAYYVPLPSGWNAGFIVTPKNPTAYPLPATSKVSFLFKSDWAAKPGK